MAIVAGAVAVLTFLVGLFLGTVIGVVVGQALDLGSPPPAMPVLQVQAPAGVSVTVDGSPVTSTVSLTPGVPHPVIIQRPGEPASQTNLTLQPGEVRVLVISAVDASPEPGSP